MQKYFTGTVTILLFCALTGFAVFAAKSAGAETLVSGNWDSSVTRVDTHTAVQVPAVVQSTGSLSAPSVFASRGTPTGTAASDSWTATSDEFPRPMRDSTSLGTPLPPAMVPQDAAQASSVSQPASQAGQASVSASISAGGSSAAQ